MKFRTLLAAATCFALPVLAHAQPVTGPYVSLGGGLTFLFPVNYMFHASGDNGRYLYRPGWTVMGGAGYGFGDGIRVELDGDYLTNTVHKADDQSTLQTRVHGREKNYGGFINVFYDVTIPGSPVYPYFGVGAGYQQVAYDVPIGAYDAIANRSGHVFSAHWSVAYDLIAGISYPIAAVPGLSITLEDRFMQLVQNRNYVTSANYRMKIGNEYSDSVLAGVRYALFQPAPPPPAPAPQPMPAAAPAPAPAKTYLVFFDWDKYNLTPRAVNIIAQAAADSKSQQVTTLDVSGYTDTSGTPKYNMGLSERRAKSVAAQLVADGVPASEIETHAFGETHLLVPTGPNVREPQNRRVEIVLH